MPHPRVLISPALVFLASFALVTPGAFADEPDSLAAAIAAGSTKFTFRYRNEIVDQKPMSKDAGASTLKSRLTWKSATFNNWGLGVEADYVAVIGGERYNSTVNGNSRYPVVADPEGFDLNQAFVTYKAGDANLTAGRQRILHDDQRFVGGVGWRQNEQTYDALRVTAKPVDNLAIDYSYVANVNRIFSPTNGAQPSDWDSNSHFVTASYKADTNVFRGFAYLLDFENSNGIINSTSTFGIGYSGTLGPVKLDGTLATQTDYADSPLNYDAVYVNLAAAWKIKPVTITAGFELLGSDAGLVSFRTPLATLHKFQGWADKFLTTPPAGIEDLSIGIAGAVGKLKLAGTWHDFSANEGGADYGTELDLVATYPITTRLSAQLKYANYDADTFATDTTKVWLSFMLNL